MTVNEPTTTALILVGIGLLRARSVASSRASARLGLPLSRILIIIGMLAGSEGIGGIAFDDYHLSYQVGILALVLILFDGGLQTPMRGVKLVAVPSLILATIGVVVTAAITAGAGHLFGLSWPTALLLGAIVSSTDAAAVFSVLTASGTRLRQRIGLTLEVESGVNDPMAVLLTTALTANIARPGSVTVMHILGEVVVELAIGGALGFLIGRLGREVLGRLRLPASGLYPAFTIALAFIAYGLPTLVHGSGFLAVYVAGLTLGNGPLAHGANLRRVHDASGWVAQVLMFLVLGLLVFPTHLISVAGTGIGIALVIALVARPLAVALCLLPFEYTKREILYVGIVGLRGAVPIVLATIPVMAGIDPERKLFEVVFFVAVLGAILPGAMVPYITRLLRIESKEPPRPTTVIDIESDGGEVELRSYYVEATLAVAGATLREIPFPKDASVTAVERARELIPPNGDLSLQAGDHVFVLARREDRGFIELLFGVAEE